MIGDAAGAVENFYGEGLYYGLSSSKLAAEILIDTINNNSSFDKYTKLLKSEILIQTKFSRINSNLFYNNQRFGYHKMVRNKLINYFYAELINGRITQRQCYFYTLGILPISMFAPKLKDKPFEEIGLNIAVQNNLKIKYCL